ncbi:DUF4932 domain-containing protein [Terrimonas sp. NA20]|uniref:DUF4932 domain-containing protein n=1 Tax=Terrimonas ginsenosidimutans TaxID=2908004 RepID=A0ABS9KXS9_9BACT|nr:DUF4932 domain-containing protein [Terrimonas ginsenosidimutans]MCG2617083.1 DUF4932 domain-containing protein [Terrimonas ginsenosidimutans]
MKTILLSATCLLCLKIAAQLPPVDTSGEIHIRFDHNTEFAGFIFFIGSMADDALAPGAKMNNGQLKKDWFRYDIALTEKYHAFRDDADLKTAAGFMENLQSTDIFPLLMNVAPFPAAAMHNGISYRSIEEFAPGRDSLEAARQASIFLNALNSVFKKMSFEKYYVDAAAYYQQTLKEIRSALPPKGSIAAMEQFYGKRFTEYTIMPSLTIPSGMAFGLKLNRADGTAVFNLFGPFAVQQINRNTPISLGYNNPQHILELSVHEFGHSFANPVVAALPDSLILSSRSHFEPIREAMDKQGYTTWKSCVTEHFVRAGEVMIAERMGRTNAANDLLKNYTENRKFIYLPVIIEAIESALKEGKTYKDAVRIAAERL